jgi:acetyl-CoA carboxylase carboxyltransferase component
MDDTSYALNNPLAQEDLDDVAEGGAYERAVARGAALLDKPRRGGGTARVLVQHVKQRMTVWERIKVLSDAESNIRWQNWGPALDGASLVTGVLNVKGRDVAIYGHDFTLRAGSMDATNGDKLARLITMAGSHGIPLVGMNDSAGAYVPAGVGGLDGYSEAFTALRKISGVVPSVMLMFGFNAGGGSYLPRQGSFMIQGEGTFFGLTGPNVVRSVLGEDITADALGGPAVHGASGVVDLLAADELGALRLALRLLSYIPDNNHSSPPFRHTGDPTDHFSPEEQVLLRRTFNAPSGYNTPFDMTLYMQQLCDHGEYFELQPTRARNIITAFARIGGHVVGFLANNSAVSSGQIDIAARARAPALSASATSTTPRWCS